jgi:hypothetical protein
MAMALEKSLHFCNATSIIEDNNTVTLGDQRTFKATKNAWGAAATVDLGGMTFVAEVTTTLVGAGTFDAVLTANTTNTLVAGKPLATLHFNTVSPAGTILRTTLAPGTYAGLSVGVVGVTEGAVTAGAINAYLTADKGQAAD